MLWKFNTNKIDISKLSIKLPGLDTRFEGYRIVQISDFHLGTWLDIHDLNEITNLVNHQEPDLITITGDLISFRPEQYIPELKEILSRLKSKDGILAVLGNHDHYTDAHLVRSALRDCQIMELRNCTHVIRRGSSNLVLAGIDDHMTGHDDLQAVIEQIPEETNPVILLAHEPDFADISAESGRFSLQLSGHSHGGQICLPYLGNLYLPRLGRKYPSGVYQVRDMQLYTNRGLGTSWLKFRYNCPPEITVLELLSSSHQEPDYVPLD